MAIREPGADCPDCGAALADARCAACGWRDAPLPAAYRAAPRREYAREPQDARCTEPGCSKTLAEHQAEARAIGLGRTLILPAMQQRVAEVQRPVDADDEAEHARRRAAQLERFRGWGA